MVEVLLNAYLYPCPYCEGPHPAAQGVRTDPDACEVCGGTGMVNYPLDPGE